MAQGGSVIRTGEFIQNRLESLQRHQQQIQASNHQIHHQVGAAMRHWGD